MGTNISNTIKQISDQVTRYAKSEFPGQAGKIGLRFIDDNFRNQSWEGIPWKARRKGAKRNKGRGLLIDRGILRRGNRYATGPGQVRFYNDVPYAKAHNNGFRGNVSIPAHERRLYGKFKASSLKTKNARTIKAVRGTTSVMAHTRNMRIPRRQFMPTMERPSPTLNRLVQRAVTLSMMKILKPR